jgi:hypothetical protein
VTQHPDIDRQRDHDPARVVAVPDLEGDLLLSLQLVHEVLSLLADWEHHDPQTAADPGWALPPPLADGDAAAIVANLCAASDAALTQAAQPVTPDGHHRLDPVGWAGLNPADITILGVTARALGCALLPHGCAWAAEALAAVADEHGTRPEALVAAAVRLHNLFSIEWDDTLAALAQRLPAGAGTVTLDHAGHAAYSQLLRSILDIWHDGNPLAASAVPTPWP